MVMYMKAITSTILTMAPQNSITDIPPPSEIIGKTISQTEVEPVITAATHGKKQPPMKIVWRNVMIMASLHLGALYAITLIPKSYLLTTIFAIFYYMVSGVGITAGAHRLWSHKSYKAKVPLRILLVLMQSSALQNDVIEWTRDHRVHHKYSETDADPHNAKRGFFFSHIGWLLVKKHPDVKEKGKQLNFSDLHNDKILVFQRRYYKPLAILMCFVVPTVVPWYFWSESLWNSYFIAGVLRYILCLNATWCVNSVAHLWGSKPYDKFINPCENTGVVLGAVGEGYHNYHHTFPTDYAASEFGTRLNITTMFIDFMALIGQATDRKTTAKDVITKRKQRTGDGCS